VGLLANAKAQSAAISRVIDCNIWLTSPSSGQAAISAQLRHPRFLACHSRAALARAGQCAEATNVATM